MYEVIKRVRTNSNDGETYHDEFWYSFYCWWKNVRIPFGLTKDVLKKHLDDLTLHPNSLNDSGWKEDWSSCPSACIGGGAEFICKDCILAHPEKVKEYYSSNEFAISQL